jgi:hypothetical protein
MLGGGLPYKYGIFTYFLVSKAQHTGFTSGSSTVEGFVTMSSLSFALFTPEGRTVHKFMFIIQTWIGMVLNLFKVALSV